MCSPCAAKCSPPAAKCTPTDVSYQPVCYPVANQTAPYATFSAICCICRPSATKCSPQAAKSTSQRKPNDHPRTKNAPTLAPNSTQNTLMLQCNYGKKILGAGGRGVSLQIRRAVLAQLLGVSGNMYNGLYTYL